MHAPVGVDEGRARLRVLSGARIRTAAQLRLDVIGSF